ncbi:MAG: MFS transporter, partial [Chitinophagaceae bacterium]
MNTQSLDTPNNFFENKVLGHPAGLFVLFFTEMWERFSYYGMRALLVLFLISNLDKGGWAWPEENALALYGTYTSLVYLTTIMGGYLADRYLGYRWAVVIGAFLMTLGHASMAVETPAFLYLGIGFLIFGNGFFKPNMTSIVSYIYKDHPEKKDGAYTIFYMGVNAGAFLGIMLCGYIGETVSWSWGFGLAGIFMFFGMLQFYFTQGIFGDVGKKPTKEDNLKKASADDGDKRVPFTNFDLTLIVLSLLLGLVWILNDP